MTNVLHLCNSQSLAINFAVASGGFPHMWSLPLSHPSPHWMVALSCSAGQEKYLKPYTSKARLPFLAPLGAHHGELPMSNLLSCSERQEQVREEKVLPSSRPSSRPSSLTTKNSQILLSLSCKMAENHLATSGTQARYQLDTTQTHQAIYHCHS